MIISLSQLLTQASEIESILGYTFNDKNLLALAFIHRSFVNENREATEQHNERLEFLGDSVLGLLVAEYLYTHCPETPEGELSYLRSRLVEGGTCINYIQKLNLGQYLLLGKGERMNDGRGRATILADLFEAIIGAIYLDGQMEAAKNFLFSHFTEEIQAILSEPLRNWKAELQDYSQKVYQQTPFYKVVSEMGPDHSKLFCVAVFVNDQEIGRGEGASKKEAQQAAAADAFMRREKADGQTEDRLELS